MPITARVSNRNIFFAPKIQTAHFKVRWTMKSRTINGWASPSRARESEETSWYDALLFCLIPAWRVWAFFVTFYSKTSFSCWKSPYFLPFFLKFTYPRSGRERLFSGYVLRIWSKSRLLKWKGFVYSFFLSYRKSILKGLKVSFRIS